MPTYEYRCKKCGYQFEEFQKITDPPLTTCPKCKGTVQKLISSGTGLIFKGSGFYTTDYRKDKSKIEPKKKDNSNLSGSNNKKKEEITA